MAAMLHAIETILIEVGIPRCARDFGKAYFPAPAAIFFTMASTSLRSLSFRFMA
jgi:hypothetical protein